LPRQLVQLKGKVIGQSGVGNAIASM
jgi:hypothetical protein